MGDTEVPGAALQEPLTCTGPLVWHQGVAFAAAALVAALGVGAVRVAAPVGDGALVDVWGQAQEPELQGPTGSQPSPWSSPSPFWVGEGDTNIPQPQANTHCSSPSLTPVTAARIGLWLSQDVPHHPQEPSRAPGWCQGSARSIWSSTHPHSPACRGWPGSPGRRSTGRCR